MKNILLVSQSYYPNIGGVSSLLLNIIKQLKLNDFNVYTLHFTLRENDDTRPISGEYETTEYTVDINSFSKITIDSFTIFKEKLYNVFHGFDSTIEIVKLMNGFKEFQEVNKYFGDIISDLIQKHNIDLIHIHDYQILLAAEKQKYDIPKIISLHFPFLKYSSTINEFLSNNLKPYDKIILSTIEYKENALLAGIPGSKLMVIPPFIDENLLNFQSNANYRVGDYYKKNNKIILSVQRFDSKSGHNQLVESFYKLLSVMPNAILVLVGGDSFTDQISSIRYSYKKNIVSLVESLGIADKVLFVGSVNYLDLGRWYSIANVVCMLSKMECFGLSITEAMSFGKPVIVTRVGGLKYQVIDEANGFLVDINDVDRTTSALFRILSDEKIEASFSLQSRKIYERLYLPRDLIKVYLNMYDLLCK